VAPIAERLKKHSVIGLDTCIFIYHFEAHPRYLPLTQGLLEGIQSGRWQAVTSTLTLMEVAVRPWQLAQAAVAHEYQALLVHFPNLAVADVTRDVAGRAAQLRALYHLRPADALQIATALMQDATAFVTNDLALARLSPTLDVVVLDDLV